MSSTKSLPSNFKQMKYQRNNNSSPILSLREKSTISADSSEIIVNNSSSLSSSVKKSSPLTKPWFIPEDTILLLNDDSYSGTNSSKSWMSQRWSTVSGSLIIRNKHQKAMAYRLWVNRQKRRTYPPCNNILKQERKNFFVSLTTGASGVGTLPHQYNSKKVQRRQSLADILTTFYRHTSGSTVSSSSSASRKLSKILKKKGKQPYRNRKKVSLPPLQIGTTTTTTVEGELDIKSAVIMSMFQPPPTISSKSSTPSTPIKFPTPPKRFSAVYVDFTGRRGKVDYKRPKESRSQQFLNLIHHGVAHKLTTPTVNERSNDNDNHNIIDTDQKSTNYIDNLIEQQQPQSNYCINKYNTQLSIDATLFLFGFIFFPFWWVGAWLYFRRRQQEQYEEEQLYYDNDLFSLRTISYLNTIFSFLSLALLTVIIALIIWLVKSS